MSLRRTPRPASDLFRTDEPERRVSGKAHGVVYVFIARQAVHRLTQQNSLAAAGYSFPASLGKCSAMSSLSPKRSSNPCT